VKAFPGGVFYLETETEALVATLASDLARQHGFKLDAPAPATPE
jgi:surfactin synthase thioesterase subunit